MVKRSSGVRRRGLSAYKVHELLTGRIRYPLQGYDGYGYGDDVADRGSHDAAAESFISDEMRADWEANREALLAFWRSGKHASDETLAEVGLNVNWKPWLWVEGSRSSLPWAAKVFDKPSFKSGRDTLGMVSWGAT